VVVQLDLALANRPPHDAVDHLVVERQELGVLELQVHAICCRILEICVAALGACIVQPVGFKDRLKQRSTSINAGNQLLEDLLVLLGSWLTLVPLVFLQLLPDLTGVSQQETRVSFDVHESQPLLANNAPDACAAAAQSCGRA